METASVWVMKQVQYTTALLMCMTNECGCMTTNGIITPIQTELIHLWSL